MTSMTNVFGKVITSKNSGARVFHESPLLDWIMLLTNVLPDTMWGERGRALN